MSLAGNTNLNPNQTVAPDDVMKIVENAFGKARAELLGVDRKKAQDAVNDPDHAANMAKEAAAVKTKENARWNKALGNGRLDLLANKEPEEMDSLDRARMFVRAVQCIYHGQQIGRGIEGAIERAKDFGQVTLAKALEASDFDSGGFMLQPAFADGIIDELLPKSIYMRALPAEAIIEMPEGGFHQPFEDDGADSQWAGEGTEVNAEEITGGQINMQPRKLITIVPASNDLLLGAPGKSDRFILSSIIRGMKTKLDVTLIRGVGAANEPKGLSGLLAAGNEFSVTLEGALTQAILVEELIYLQTILEESNVDLETDTPWYGFSPRTKNFLRAQRATDGILFPTMEMGAGSTLLGAIFGATSNIPNNITATYSEIYFAALSHMMLGRTEEQRIGIFPGGTYNNAAGNKVSGISADQTVFSVIGKWDHAAGQRGNEIARANDVDWT